VIGRLLAAGLLAMALAAPPACARLVMDNDERAVLRWFTTNDDPALAYITELRGLVLVEEYVRRRLLLSRCVDPSVYRGVDRLANPRYLGYVAGIAADLKRDMQHIHDEGRMVDTWRAALIYSYRQSLPSTRAALNKYLATDEARNARIWAVRFARLEGFYDEFAFDVNTGGVHAPWLHWLDEFLRRAELRDTFIAAANGVSPGLGDALRAFVSTPIAGPLDAARRAELDRLSRELSQRLPAISDKTFEASDRNARASALAWNTHPFVKRVLEVQTRLDAAGPLLAKGRPGVDDDIIAFMRTAQGPREEQEEVAGTILGFVKIEVEATCSTLK